MFDQAELAQLIGGENTMIDMDDLKEHSVVTGYPNNKTIKAFWKASTGLFWSCWYVTVADETRSSSHSTRSRDAVLSSL